jgi:hypothetical protein
MEGHLLGHRQDYQRSYRGNDRGGEMKKEKHRHEGYIYRYDSEGAHFKCIHCKKEIVLDWIIKDKGEK